MRPRQLAEPTAPLNSKQIADSELEALAGGSRNLPQSDPEERSILQGAERSAAAVPYSNSNPAMAKIDCSN